MLVVDLYIIQLLNNGGDGFGLKNVGFVYFGETMSDNEVMFS
jgi:hypothetical protein